MNYPFNSPQQQPSNAHNIQWTLTWSQEWLCCFSEYWWIVLEYLQEHSVWQDCDVGTCIDFERHTAVMDAYADCPWFTICCDAAKEDCIVLLFFNLMHRFWCSAHATVVTHFAACMAFTFICRTISCKMRWSNATFVTLRFPYAILGIVWLIYVLRFVCSRLAGLEHSDPIHRLNFTCLCFGVTPQ